MCSLLFQITYFNCFSGAFGEVKLVVDSRNPNCALAMKCMNLTEDEQMLKEFRKEVCAGQLGFSIVSKMKILGAVAKEAL